YFWPDFIASLKKTHPELKLSIKTNNISNNLKDLESGQLDMLVDAEPRVVGDFSSWVLYRDHFNFYGKKSAIPNNLTPETIEKIPLVSCPSAFDQENKTILYHLEEKGYYFKEKIELDSFTAVATFCKKGLGLGVLPQKLAASSVESGKLAEITLKGFSQKGFGIHSICATAKSDSTDNPRIRFLLKLLKNWFK
ncbi:MAG: LysR family transcriptional regulator substrate-binding protein, partial [Bdellovibrio sp.]